MGYIIIPREFWRIDVELAEEKLQGSLSEDLQDTLARLAGWYDAGQRWKKVNVDNQGRLLVSLNAGQTSVGNLSKTVVTNVATKVLAANTNRRSFILQNTGTFIISMGVDATVLTTTGIQLPPGASFNDATFIGDIWCICGGATGEVRVLEF